MFRHWCVTRCWDGGVNGVGVNGAVDVGRMPPWVHSPWPFLWVPWTEVLLLLLVLRSTCPPTPPNSPKPLSMGM